MSNSIQPTQTNERHHFLDVLRGFALIGVLIANMAYHSGYWFLSSAQQEQLPLAEAGDQLLWWIHFLTDGKFYSIFSLLFGLGFALQLERSLQREQPFAARFSRRLGLLFLFGLLHGVLFYVGDILMVYALTGFVLLLFRKVADRHLLWWVVGLLILPILQYGYLWIQAPPPNLADDGYMPFFEQLIKLYREGSFADMVRDNIDGLTMARFPNLIFTGRFFRVLAMFLLGYYIARKKLYIFNEAHIRLVKKVLLWGIIIGIPCNIVLANLMETNAYYGFWDTGIYEPMVYAFGVPALGLAWASALYLAFNRANMKKYLMFLAPFGRMALTNYLMQSIITCFIYKGYGFKLFATQDPVYYTLVGFGILLFQLVFSYLWLGRFQYGPMEWLWRSLTYRKIQPLKAAVHLN